MDANVKGASFEFDAKAIRGMGFSARLDGWASSGTQRVVFPYP
jgi:hypothetical protein